MSTQIQASVELRELDQKNYREILELAVSEDQKKFVASNAISIAQAYFHKEAWFRGIYAGDTAVGFVMLEIDTLKPEYYLWRYMIDKRYQGQGYGYQALMLVIDHVKTLPNASTFFLSFVPQEGNPKGFYEKLGFKETGEVEEGERIMRLELGT